MRHVRHLLLLAGLAIAMAAPCQSSQDPLEPIILLSSVDGGYHATPITVELLSNQPAAIYYTLDGSRPDERSPRYSRPIRIEKNTSLRAVAIGEHNKSKLIGHTYLIGEPATNLPTVCISLPSWVLFDPEYGMFMLGTKAIDSLYTKPGANFWTRKEVFIHAEIFESDGQEVHNSPMGLRLFGGVSRLFPQKSLALVGRDEYGKKRIRHELFGPDEVDDFKYIVLRNSGSDWGKSHLRDAFMTGLVKDWDLETQAYRPAHVYINGSYWGIYNIREKVNRHFLDDHRDVDKDSLDLLEHWMVVKRGGREHYRRMIRFLKERDLSEPVNYAWIEGQMEVDNFLDYQIAQIYFDNKDAGGNIKFWRPQKPGGRWRWILFDTDWGFGLHKPDAYTYNSLAFHTEPNGPSWPNPPWSTLILRKLLENPGCRRTFVNRFADHLNYSFHPDRVEHHLREIVAPLLPEMPRHFERWRLRESRWKSHLAIISKFGQERPRYLRQYLREYFDAGKDVELVVESSKGGAVLINDNLNIRGQTFRGQYYERFPVDLVAKPDFGYRFSHWETDQGKEDLPRLHLKLDPRRTKHLKAVFERFDHPLAGQVVINEIGPNNRNKRGGDWLELYNRTREPVNLEGWFLTDGGTPFFLPSVELPPKDYLVICEDSARFVANYPRAYNVIGGLPFGINKRRETLGLYSLESAGIDSLAFTAPPTDSLFTLSLLLPSLHNANLENWQIREGPGTPCAPNPYYVASRIERQQKTWIRIAVSVAVLMLCMLLLRLRSKGLI